MYEILAARDLSTIVKVSTGEIVHEWVEEHGGAENVLDAVMDIYPETRVTALWNNAPHRFGGRISETIIGRTPLRHSKALALPVMPSVWRHMGPSEAEWVLSISHLFAHHARFSGPARNASKLVYVYTPARYIWSPEYDERGASRLIKLSSIPIKPLDRRRAQEAKSIASISQFVADRVEKYWYRESEVIYPPVAARAIIDGLNADANLTGQELQILDALPPEFILGASRFVPYKRLDLVIKAGTVSGLPVVLAGSGPQLEYLRGLADQAVVPVTFVERPSTALLHRLFQRATAYVFPALEDFGITPLEAMAAGTGVVSLDRGGASETVVEGETGSQVGSFDSAELKRAVEVAAAVRPQAARNRALQFDTASFSNNIQAWVTAHVG